MGLVLTDGGEDRSGVGSESLREDPGGSGEFLSRDHIEKQEKGGSSEM